MDQAEASPTVIWITGLSGAGKTTLGRRVHESLKAVHPSIVFLDGDELREVWGDDLGYSPEDRLRNAYRLSRMCRFLVKQGVTVVCATMSLFPEIWRWNREHIRNYMEVYVRVRKETLRSRDCKGLYSLAMRGEETNVGVDIPFQEPTSPHLVVDNDSLSLHDLSEVANRIVARVQREEVRL